MFDVITKIFTIFLKLYVITVQFVVPGVTQADSSPVHNSGGVYPYWPNRTVDGNTSQNIRACLHTALNNVKVAWLRIDLQRVRSLKSVKFWYRNDSGYISKNQYALRQFLSF